MNSFKRGLGGNSMLLAKLEAKLDEFIEFEILVRCSYLARIRSKSCLRWT